MIGGLAAVLAIEGGICHRALTLPVLRRFAPPVAADLQSYITTKTFSPALEFLSPVKGPSLEQICVAVGTGQSSPEKGAAQYDSDVIKEAKQLGLPGW